MVGIKSSSEIWKVFRLLDEKEQNNKSIMSSRPSFRHTEKLLIWAPIFSMLESAITLVQVVPIKIFWGDRSKKVQVLQSNLIWEKIKLFLCFLCEGFLCVWIVVLDCIGQATGSRISIFRADPSPATTLTSQFQAYNENFSFRLFLTNDNFEKVSHHVQKPVGGTTSCSFYQCSW